MRKQQKTEIKRTITSTPHPKPLPQEMILRRFHFFRGGKLEGGRGVGDKERVDRI
jgi:hypothetical protein